MHTLAMNPNQQEGWWVVTPRSTSSLSSVLVCFTLLAVTSPGLAAPKREPSDALAGLVQRVSAYCQFRDQLSRELPPLRINADPAEFTYIREELGYLIRSRRGAEFGEIFSPEIARQLSDLLVVNRVTWAAIMDDNPGEFALDVNANYPDELPLSTVPASVLAILPELPRGMEYRFVGRHLILRDAQANVIVDYVPFALFCSDCGAGVD